MSVGDFKWFAQALTDLGNKQHDLTNDVLKFAIIKGTVVPAVDTPTPHCGGTGTTNFLTDQVATGTSYTGPITLANKTWGLGAGGPILQADPITLAKDAAGFTNGKYGILFNSTDAQKRALGFVDLGTLSIAQVQALIDWNGAVDNTLLYLSQT